MTTAKPSMVEQVLNLHRRHYGEAFAVVVQDENLVPRVLQLLIERRQKKTAGRLTIAPVASTIAPTRSGPVLVRTAGGHKLMFADKMQNYLEDHLSLVLPGMKPLGTVPRGNGRIPVGMLVVEFCLPSLNCRTRA